MNTWINIPEYSGGEISNHKSHGTHLSLDLTDVLDANQVRRNGYLCRDCQLCKHIQDNVDKACMQKYGSDEPRMLG